MDPVDPGQGQDKPPEQSCFLTPSSKGRQRKKNPKYDDYETDDANDAQTPQRKTSRGSSGGRRGATSKRSPARSENANSDTQQTEDGETEAADNGQISEETPAKAVRAKRTPRKKTPAKRTPAKKTPAKKSSIGDGDVPTGEGGVADAAQRENGRQKRKYVRRRPAQGAEPMAETPSKESRGEPPSEAEEDTPRGGRCRRGAAKAALKYLHILAKEVLNHHSDESGPQPGPNGDSPRTEPDSIAARGNLKGSKGRRGRKRKRVGYDSDPAEDEDFVPDVEEEEEVEETEGEDEADNSDSDFRASGRGPGASHANRNHTGPSYRTSNGLTSNIMRSVWEASATTKKFREEHHSGWVFPAWIPSAGDWRPVQPSDLEECLPRERRSAAFRVSRVGLGDEETPLRRLSRFGAVAAHPDRWDMVLFAGGPVWAMEWCPVPDGAPAPQYVALACHRGMDDKHCVNKVHAGPGLVQLWAVGALESNSRPDSLPALAYGFTQDKGFIWHLKWCPAGGWEPPTSGRNAPLLPRLGLLAVATSTGVVTIYSLPHPNALLATKGQDDADGQRLPIYQAEGVLTLKLGAFKAPRHDRSGQVLTMDWLPEKPHNVMAVGFYDGVVGLWDLSTQSALLRVREPDKTLSLLPYRCLRAHDHAVRALAFCPASRYLLVTAGEDRYVKAWDLRRLDNPVSVLKRFLTNEVCWPLNAFGIMPAQENAYVANGTQGVHYIDFNLRSFFAIPRANTVWSISYTDWLNSVVTADIIGDVILSVLPQIAFSPQYVKRTLERRFPVYLTSLVPRDATEEEDQDVGGAEKEKEMEEEVEEEEEGGAVEEGGKTAGSDAGSEGGNESNRASGRDGERGRREKNPPLRFQTYREAVKKFCLHHTDNNMATFANSEKRPVWKRMKNTELTARISMDDMPLAALHKVRFSPNLCCHTWVASGGQAGLVRLNCLSGMFTSQAQFGAQPSAPKDPAEAAPVATDNL